MKITQAIVPLLSGLALAAPAANKNDMKNVVENHHQRDIPVAQTGATPTVPQVPGPAGDNAPATPTPTGDLLGGLTGGLLGGNQPDTPNWKVAHDQRDLHIMQRAGSSTTRKPPVPLGTGASSASPADVDSLLIAWLNRILGAEANKLKQPTNKNVVRNHHHQPGEHHMHHMHKGGKNATEPCPPGPTGTGTSSHHGGHKGKPKGGKHDKPWKGHGKEVTAMGKRAKTVDEPNPALVAAVEDAAAAQGLNASKLDSFEGMHGSHQLPAELPKPPMRV